MKTVKLTSSNKKIDLIIQVAKEMGIKAEAEYDLTDEEMALPGPKPTKAQLEKWLAKEDGESYEINKAFDMMKSNLEKKRKKKNGH